MTFKTKVSAGLAAALAILLFVAVLSYFGLVRSGESRQWVTHTHTVLENLDEVLTNVIDAETGQRGYLLTGDDSYLEPYDRGLQQVTANVNRLRGLTVDNPRQQQALDHLQPLLDAKLAELQDRIVTRKRKGLAAGIAAVSQGSGKQFMDQIRVVIAAMRHEEELLLAKRAAELDATTRYAKIVIVIGESLGFLFFFAAGVVIQQEMNRRKRADEEVRELNAVLERRVAERTAELAERAKDLEKSNMELQQFAYVASHDLQEPLRTIASFTQLLAKRYQDKLDDKAREFINFAVDGSKRMQTLINDLLTYSRVGTQSKPLEPVNCDALLDRVLQSLKRAIEDTRAVIVRDPLPTVLADEVQLGQLFQNLVGNALKFRREVPRIHISAERLGCAWKISVRDNGIGIAPEHKDRIFVIFQRLHTKAHYPGTGIGLAICKKIAERHGGRIWVEPSPDGGSAFSFTIADGQDQAAKEQEDHELRINANAD